MLRVVQETLVSETPDGPRACLGVGSALPHPRRRRRHHRVTDDRDDLDVCHRRPRRLSPTGSLLLCPSTPRHSIASCPSLTVTCTLLSSAPLPATAQTGCGTLRVRLSPVVSHVVCTVCAVLYSPPSSLTRIYHILERSLPVSKGWVPQTSSHPIPSHPTLPAFLRDRCCSDQSLSPSFPPSY